ncbi:MAG: hypothetical protein ACE364_09980 [Chlorobiota bacterium]
MGTIDKLKAAYEIEKENNTSKKFILLAVLTPLLMMAFMILMNTIDPTYLKSEFAPNNLSKYFGVPILSYIGIFQPIFLLTMCYWVFSKSNDMEYSKDSKFYSIIPKILVILKYGIINIVVLIAYLAIYLPIQQNLYGVSLEVNFLNLILTLIIGLFTPLFSLPLLLVISVFSKWMSKYRHYVIGMFILWAANFTFAYLPINFPEIPLWHLTYFVNIQMVPMLLFQDGEFIPYLKILAILATNIAVTALVIYYLKRGNRTDIALEG